MSAAVLATDLAVQVKGKTLLYALDLRVEPGEWLSIVGPNGAGKSTLIRALAGVGQPTGTVAIDGTGLSHASRRERGRLVAWIPQTPAIPPGMRVVDYVLLGRTPHLPLLGAERSIDIETVHEVIAELDLAALAERDIATLSGGERQRAVIARALAQQAPVILADEPTSALDLGHQQEVLAVLQRLRRGRGHTIITTMHDLTLAGLYADRVMLLAEGRVQAYGTPIEVITEERIARHFGAAVEVRPTPSGLTITPRFPHLGSAETDPEPAEPHSEP